MNILACSDPECPLMKTAMLFPIIAVGVIITMMIVAYFYKGENWD